MNLPDYLDGIRLEHRVSRDDRPVLLHALRNQHAIERVAMMHRETLESEQMIDADGEGLDSVFRQSAEHVGTGRPGELQPARLYLNTNLPDAGNAKRKIGFARLGNNNLLA
jgi:hypothetical protein